MQGTRSWGCEKHISDMILMFVSRLLTVGSSTAAALAEWMLVIRYLILVFPAHLEFHPD